MNYFEKMLLIYLRDSKIEMEITGFDLDGFEQTLSQGFKCRLELIEDTVYIDDDLMTDTEKVERIKGLFQNVFTMRTDQP